MSQYQPFQYPGQQPTGPLLQSPQQVLRAPARRASIMLLIFGGLGLLCGTCITAFAFAGPLGQVAQQPTMMQIPQVPGWSTVQILRVAYATAGIGSLVVGIVAVVLGLLVRGGRIGWVICGIVFSALIALLLLVEAAGTLLQVTQNPIVAVLGFMVIAIPILLIGLTLFWLAQAARNAGRLREQDAMLQNQMWQYQQMQSAYGAPAGGYGYGAPLPPTGAPPLAPTPSSIVAPSDPLTPPPPPTT